VDPEAARQRRDEIATRHGEWTAHDIRLADGVSTRVEGGADPSRLRRVVQLAADLTGRPLGELRVLDLGALEGQYAVEFALHGAGVVAIEGREANAAKARLAGEVLGLDNFEVREEDVRGLSVQRNGSFDVVLCLGLLYHLDQDDLFPFLDRLAEVCTSLLILDTHVGLRARQHHRHGGHDYRGVTFVEHSPRASDAQRQRSLWASLDNEESFWPTRASLLNALKRAGFTSVLECGVPPMTAPRDRLTFAAVRGTEVELRSLPAATGPPAGEVPERQAPRWIRNQSRVFLLGKRIALRILAARERRSSQERGGSSRPS
jgi:SAM-dependent methyltransferase